MHYAICYVSTLSPNISKSQIETLLEFSRDSNNQKEITGILLYSQGNFLQVLEGEKEQVRSLYKSIEKDSRHYDITPIFRKDITKPAYKEYEVDFLSVDSTYTEEDLDIYLSQVEKLDPTIRASVSYILKNFS